VDCVEIWECPGLYKGVLDAAVEVGQARGYERGMSFRFPADAAEDVKRVYLFCHYEVAGDRGCECGHRDFGHRDGRLAKHPGQA
jgi:hypothetical protein